ncbi:MULTISPECIES: hypothetical protein [Helcococcus]|uniref:Uncharacterized protein n=1 Tax=Helcococcus bovis TaxID=3153252 RepID=A0ABW9F5W6_9FIRM
MKVKVISKFFGIKENKNFEVGEILTSKDTTIARLKFFVSEDVCKEIKEDEKSK